MKKIIFICFLVSLFSLSFLFSFSRENCLLSIAENYSAKVSFYVSTPQDISGLECIKNGENGIVSCGSNIAKDTYQKLKSIVGISFTTVGSREDFLNICEKLNLVIKQKDSVNSTLTTYLCYSKKIQNFLFVDNEKINIQIAINKNIITVGTPLILGSY